MFTVRMRGRSKAQRAEKLEVQQQGSMCSHQRDVHSPMPRPTQTTLTGVSRLCKEDVKLLGGHGTEVLGRAEVGGLGLIKMYGIHAWNSK